MKKLIIALILILLIASLLIYLQIFLSKKENKFLGLILPAMNFLLSFFAVLAFYAYDPNAQGIQVFVSLAIAMFVANIPTIILLAIYFGVREKIKINHEIEKMSIKDLQ